MQAITYRKYGPPQVLELSEVAQPTPKDDEVLVRVRAAEATKADCELRSFNFSVKWFWLPLRLAIGIRRPRRRVLGGYFAGEIAAVGRNVTQFTVGQRVFGGTGLGMGAYGEYLTLPSAGTLATMPTNMTFEQAAAVPLGGLNALHFMRLANVQEGESVLINGAGGSIGSHAVQIAKSMGAEVTAVDAGHKEQMLRGLGVDHFVDYTKEDFTRAGHQYDVIFDMVPNNSYRACIRTLKSKGRYLSGNPRLSVMLRSVLTTHLTDKTARFAFAKETVEELRTLTEMIEEGSIAPIVDQVCPMHRAAEAHRLVETEQRRGAIVISIGDREGTEDGGSRLDSNSCAGSGPAAT